MTHRHIAVLVTALAAALATTASGCSPGGEGASEPAPPSDGVPFDAAPTDTAPTDRMPTYARYVALGDSFAALGPTDAPTSGPAQCLRSTRNYPAVLAERDDVGELVDVTCGGAETTHMTGPQITETPPQFEALTPDTDLVTLTIGGNDIGFGAMVGCILQTPRAETGAPCRDRLEFAVTDQLDALGDRLDGVYSGIRDRSPDARIVTTAYLPLVPADGGCEFVSGMSPGDVTWTRHVTERINMIVSDAADRADVDVVQPDDADDRHACAPAMERYTDFTGEETASHPMHPTEAGHLAMAEAVGAVL